MGNHNVSCFCCGKMYSPNMTCWRCEVCSFRICRFCLQKHKGKFGSGGFKCSQCQFGHLKLRKFKDN